LPVGPNGIFTGSATSNWNNLYESLTLSFITKYFCINTWAFNYFLGLESDYIRLNQTFIYNNGSNYYNIIKQNTWTIGPQLGFKINKCIWSTLSFNTETSLSLLAANLKRSYFSRYPYTSGGITIIYNQTSNAPNQWCVTPAFHFKLGFDYGFDMACTKIGLGVGYEFNFFNSILSYGGKNNDYSNQGLYLKGSLQF
jgi:hypothetical protein